MANRTEEECHKVMGEPVTRDEHLHETLIMLQKTDRLNTKSTCAIVLALIGIACNVFRLIINIFF